MAVCGACGPTAGHNMCLKKKWRDQPGPTHGLACLLQRPPPRALLHRRLLVSMRTGKGSCAEAIAGEMGRPWLCWRGRDGKEGACAHRLLPGAWRGLVGSGGAWRGLAGPGRAWWGLAGPSHQDGAVVGGRGDSHHQPLRRRRVAAAPSAGPFTPGLSQAGALLWAGMVEAVPQTGFTFEAPTLHSQIFVVLLRCVADLFLLIF